LAMTAGCDVTVARRLRLNSATLAAFRFGVVVTIA
jgi:hypothetical protein